MTITKRYTLIGSPTDTNGVITNTSSSNYIQTLTGLSSDYDVILKIKFNTTNQNIAIFSLSTANSNVCIYSDSSGKIAWWNGWSGESSNSDNDYQTTNNWVFVRLYYDNGTPMYAVKQSSEQETLTQALAGNWDTKYAYMYGVDPNVKWNIGYTPFNQWNLEGATVDLTNSSINGELFYEDVQPQPSSSLIKIGASDISKLYFGSNELSKLYLGSNLIYSNTPPTPSDPWYSWAITEVGSLYNNNNSYVGFNDSNFLQMQDYPTSTINNLEIELRFTTSVTIANGMLMGQSTTNLTTPQIEVYNGQLCVDVTDNNSVWAAIIRTSAISPNTEYSLNVKWDSVSQDVTAVLTDIASGTQSSLEPTPPQSRHTSSVNWSEVARLGVDITSGGWGGTIDLNNSYIKINGQYMGCSEGVGPKPQPSDEWIQTFNWGTPQITWDNPKTQIINIPGDNVSHERLYKLVFNNTTMDGSWAIVDYPYGNLDTINAMWWDDSWHPLVDGTPFSDTTIYNFTINPTSDTVYYKFTYNPSNDTKTFSVSRDKINWESVSRTGTYSAVSPVSMMFMNRSNDYQTSGVYLDTTESYIKFGNRYMVKPYSSS